MTIKPKCEEIVKNQGTKITINEQENFDSILIDGWFGPESSGVWTSGTESIIQIKLPVKFGRYRLTLFLSPFLHEKLLPKQRLSVFTYDELIFEAEIGFEQKIECEISESAALGRDYINVSLRHPDAASPFELNLSEDRRLLSFKMSSFQLISIDDIDFNKSSDELVPFDISTHTMSHSSILLNDEAPRFSGEALIKFHYTPHIGTFGRSDRHETIQIFNSILPPAQIPIKINENSLQEIRNKRLVVRDHISYPAPVAISAYSINGGHLWGDGIMTLKDNFVLLWDCVPRYLRNLVSDDGHKFDIPLLKDDAWTARNIVASDIPIACPLHPNMIYGHFLLEMLPRFYVLSLLIDFGVKLRVALPKDLPEWIESFIGLFFPEKIQMRYDKYRDCIDAPSLIVASMMHNDHNFHPAFNLMITDIHRRSQARSGISHANQKDFIKKKIYLSRSRFHRNKRLQNALEVESMMEDLGFQIIHPQELSLDQQLKIYAESDFIAGEFSSAIHNTMFCDFGTRVICIDYHSSYQSSIARIRRQPHCFITPDDGNFRHWRLSDDKDRIYSVNVSDLRRMVLSMMTVDERTIIE